MNWQTEYLVSAVPLGTPYEPVTGEEAKIWLERNGYSFITVDDDGVFQALSRHREALQGYHLYKRKRLTTM